MLAAEILPFEFSVLSVLPGVELVYLFLPSSMVESLFDPPACAYSSSFSIVLQFFFVLQSLHGMRMLPHFFGINLLGTVTSDTIDYVSHASHILYAADTHLRRVQKTLGSRLPLVGAVSPFSFFHLSSRAHRRVVQGKLAEIEIQSQEWARRTYCSDLLRCYCRLIRTSPDNGGRLKDIDCSSPIDIFLSHKQTRGLL